MVLNVIFTLILQIFGPGKKLGSLIIFTMCLLVITSSISMQLFCSLADFNKFEAFPEVSMWHLSNFYSIRTFVFSEFGSWVPA